MTWVRPIFSSLQGLSKKEEKKERNKRVYIQIKTLNLSTRPQILPDDKSPLLYQDSVFVTRLDKGLD